MVNAKNVAFKVNAQTPMSYTPPAFGTVINCRKPGGRRAPREQKEVRSHDVPLSNVPGSLKRKRVGDQTSQAARSRDFAPTSAFNAAVGGPARLDQPLITQKWQQAKPTQRQRKQKTISKGVDLDCWFTILTFSDPAQLLEMRSKIASCYRFLKNNPMLWKHSRNYYYGETMPDPCSELSEFQYAHLRHGHGCMSCGAVNTRKTYWAFLRRWCKTCLQSKTIKEHDAMVLLREAIGVDPPFLQECLPSGVFDSWGNFVGVGPATTHSLKTIYLLSDVQNLLAEFNTDRQADPASWPTKEGAWIAKKEGTVNERRAFARKMELWEEAMRTTKTCDYLAKKAARKAYFELKASQLDPPISLKEMESCASYRRAVAIPKEPNNTSWLQLKPKLEKEAAELALPHALPALSTPSASNSGYSTPDTMDAHQPYMHPVPGLHSSLPSGYMLPYANMPNMYR
jgi:hypothetical protein